MNRNEVLSRIREEKIVSVVRTDSPNVKEVVDHIILGGVKFIEITLTMDNAQDLIKTLAQQYRHADVFIGAGTVIDGFNAALAIANGAQFIVGPVFSREVLEVCNLYRVAYIPGVSNPQDIFEALKAGVDLLKLFPASVFPTKVVSELRAPFPQADFLISGKVNLDNALEWLGMGAAVICTGSALTKQEDNGLAAVTAAAQQFVELVHGK